MLRAQSQQGSVLARDVMKEEGPFFCPVCNGSVLLKKGRVNIAHFAHVPPFDCAYGIGESEYHRQAKVEISEALSKHPSVTKLQLERYLQEVRPDISFYLNDIPIAIEVQVSTLSLDTIERRTSAYARRGIYLLWCSPYSPALSEERYAPRLWEKYLHALYFGKIYYWVSGEVLQPVGFDPYKLWVKESSWWEGEECSAGGYHRTSKRYKTPRFEQETLITDLSPVKRKAWSSSTIAVPNAWLWGTKREFMTQA